MSPEIRELGTTNLCATEEGYDSDGEVGPFFDQVVDENVIIYDEKEVSPLQQDAEVSTGPTEGQTPIVSDPPSLTVEMVDGLKGKELKEALERRGLKKNGRVSEFLLKI